MNILTDEQIACLRQLSETDPEDDKAAIEGRKGKRVDGTCSWILDNPCFKSWDENSSNEILWFLGSPGVGKTMIFCFLIDHLVRIESASNDTVLAYYMCNDTDFDNKRNTAISIIGGLLYQLLQKRRRLFKRVLPEFRKTDLGKPQALLRLFWHIITAAHTADPGLRRVFIVIDALDECQASSRKQILESLASHLTSRSSAQRQGQQLELKIAISSRPLSIPEANLTKNVSQSIQLESSFIEKDLKAYISQQVQDLRKHSFGPDRLARIESVLLERSEGPFLWVSIVVEEMKGFLPKEAEKVLQTMPTGLHTVYAKLLSQIDDNFRASVRVLLYWVVNAVRALTDPELACAIVMNEDLKMGGLPSRSDLQEVEAILNQCKALLRVHPVNQEVHLLHQSLKDFLLADEAMPAPQEAHNQILRTLVHYLCLDQMDDVPQDVRQNTSQIRRTFLGGNISESPLREYACCYWIKHANNSGELLEDFDWLDLFSTASSKWRYCLQVYREANGTATKYRFLYDSCADAMMAIASPSQACFSFIRCQLLKRDKAPQKIALYAALLEAVRGGCLKTVQLLLNEASRSDSSSPLAVGWLQIEEHEPDSDDTQLMLERGQLGLRLRELQKNGDAIHILIDTYGQNLQIEDMGTNGGPILLEITRRMTLLKWALKTDQKAIAEQLLITDGLPEVPEAPREERSWLRTVRLNGGAMKMTVENGGKGLQIDNLRLNGGAFALDLQSGLSAIQYAAQSGHLSILQMLLEGKARDIGEMTSERTLLHINNLRLNGGTFQLHVRTKLTALQLAARNGHLDVVRYLVEKHDAVSADQKSQLALDGIGLWIGTIKMNGGAMEVLFESGMSALHWAAKCGHQEVVSYLLLQGFSIDLKSRLEIQKVKLGSNLIYCYSDPDTGNTFDFFSTEEDVPEGQFHVQDDQVSVCIENLSANGGTCKWDILSGGATALDLAVENGHESVKRLLVEYGAQLPVLGV